MPKYWGYKEASEQVGVPEGTLYAWVHSHRVPHIRLGKRHVLFPVQELLDWFEKHRVVPAHEIQNKNNS